jgi:glycerol transport system ATP-binding protein
VQGAEARLAGGVVPLLQGYGDLQGRVEIGVRPEFLRLSRDEGLPVLVRRVEDVGRHRIVRAELGGVAINVVADEGEPLPSGDVRVIFDPAHVGVYADGWLVEGRP